MGESYASLFHLGLKLINIPIRKHLSVVYKVCLCVCDPYNLENIYISFQVCIQTQTSIRSRYITKIIKTYI